MKNRYRLLVALIVLTALVLSLTAFTLHRAQSVCTMTGLTGAALEENDLYCPVNPNPAFCNPDDTNAPSTYHAAIALARAKAIDIGTPCQVSTVHDFQGNLRVDVEFSRGYHAEHYLNPNAFNPPIHTVWIYAPYPSYVQVWP